MKQYLELVREVIYKGILTENRTEVMTHSLFGTMMRIPIGESFPLLTTKKMFFRGVFEELMWFLRGETDSKILEAKKVNIWKGNTSREALDKVGLTDYPEGEAGPIYGHQWTNWGAYNQIQNAIEMLRNDFHSRRILVSAWNAEELDKMCLPPCHFAFQFFSRNRHLSCMFNMRSVDVGLGLPFNIASYALLTYLIAAVTNHVPHELIFVGGDTHVYHNHAEPLLMQCEREPLELPKLTIEKKLEEYEDIISLEFKDVTLHGYDPYPAIAMQMAV